MRPCFASLIVVAVSLHASAVPTTNSNGSVMTPNSELTRNQLVATDVSGLLSSESDPNVVFTNGELLVHGERVKIGPDETEVQEIASAVVAPVASSVTNLSSSVSDLQSSKADRSEIPGNYLSVSNKAMTAVQAESDPTVYAWAKQPNPPAEIDPTVKPWAKADKPPAETDPTVHDWAKQPNPPAETDPTVKPWAKADKPPAETDPTVHDWAKQPNPPKGMTTNAVDALANSAVVTNALTVAITNRVALLESSKADKSALNSHVENKSNPHAVTAAQVGAVPFVKDSDGDKTAVTIGSRTGDVGQNSLANGFEVTAAGYCSHAEGSSTTASADYSHAEGYYTTASGNYSHAEGYLAHTKEQDDYAFAWNGDDTRQAPYESHGPGTFNINPAGGLNGFWIGEQTLYTILTNKADKSALDAHVANTNNPHAVTAEQVGALPLVEDSEGNKTAVTIGSRNPVDVGSNSLANGSDVEASGDYSHAEGFNTTASGDYSHAEGFNTTASGYYSHAEGDSTTASGFCSHAEGYSTTTSANYSHAEGYSTTANGEGSHAEGTSTTASGYCSHAEGFYSQTRSGDTYAFAWNGDGERYDDPYTSHGAGTFNINPVGGLNGFYIGEQTLYAILTNKADKSSISATDPTFSNAVLAVNVDFATNTTGAAYVAVTNALAGFGFDADALAELPGGKVYGSIGALLAALAAAAAWLKKNKVQTLKLNDNSIETSADGGVAKLDDFFTNSNSLLTATIDARLPYPLNAVTDETGLLKDRAINTTSLASVTVPDNFTDLLVRASVASSLSVTMPDAIATKYGDTFPGEAGEYLITITKTGAAEAYVRTIKLEEVA